MKIIAQAKPDYFLVEAHQDELANLLGFYSRYSMKDKPLEIGTDIEINEVYSSIRNLGCITAENKTGSFKKKAQELRQIAAHLETINNYLSNAGKVAQTLSE